MKTKSILLNYIMNTLLSISMFIFPLISFPYISRILGPDGTGKVSMATSFVSYFLMFAQLGIPVYGVRACAKVRDNREELSKVFFELLYINLLMCVFAYVVFGVLLANVPRLSENKVLYWIISSTILFTSLSVEWFYKGLEKYTYITVRSIIFKFIALLAMFLLVKNKDDYLIYGVITIFASSASGILNIIYARKFVDFVSVRNCNFMRHYKPVFVFFAMACATTIYTSLDIVMLGFMKNDADVGYYNAAVKVKRILVSLVTSLGAVLLPRLSYYIENDMKEEFNRITKLAFSFVLMISIPLTTYFIVFAKETILFLSGNEFLNAIAPMQIITPTVLIIGISNILAIQILVPLGLEKQVLYAEVAGSIIDLCINIIFIPKLSAVGAAVGTLVAECAVTLICYIYVKRYTTFSIKEISFYKLIISTTISILVAMWIRNFNFTIFTTLVVSSATFFFMYIILLFILKDKGLFELLKLSKINNILKFK